jgi:hypothetical protein
VFSAKNRSNFDLPFRTILSIYDRWQKCSRGFVVQAKAHESHGLRDAQTALQAPAEQFCITNRQEKAGAGKCLGRADEGLEFAVALADSVSKETEGCGIAGNSPVVLDDGGRALPDRVEQFPTAVMTVDLPADAVAGVEVAWSGRSDAVPGRHVVDGVRFTITMSSFQLVGTSVMPSTLASCVVKAILWGWVVRAQGN